MRLLVSTQAKVMPSLLPAFAPWLGVLETPRGNHAPGHVMRSWEAHRLPWAADNDAFGTFNPEAYRRMLARIAGLPGCLFVTVPDMVGNAFGTLYLWQEWAIPAEEISQQPLALVGQDGMEDRPVPWGELDAIFLGGSTEWKLSRAAASLGAEALRRGKHLHMGRVNTFKRYRAAHDMGCHTIDGTNVCRWPDVWIPRCARWLRRLDSEPGLFGPDAR